MCVRLGLQAKHHAEEIRGCECIVINPVQGVKFLSQGGIQALERKKGAATTCYTRVSPWEPNQGHIGHPGGLLEEKRGFGWVEPSSREEILSRASYEAQGLTGCVAFAVHPRFGVQFYDEEAFGSDGELVSDGEWTSYTPRDPWHPMPETVPKPLQGAAAEALAEEVGVLARFDGPGWLSPPNGENYVDPGKVIEKAKKAAAATAGCVAFGVHSTEGVRLYSSEAMEEAPGWTGYSLCTEASGPLAAQLRKQIEAKDSELGSLRQAQCRHEEEISKLHQGEGSQKKEVEAAQSEVNRLLEELQRVKSEQSTKTGGGGMAEDQSGAVIEAKREAEEAKASLAAAQEKIKRLEAASRRPSKGSVEAAGPLVAGTPRSSDRLRSELEESKGKVASLEKDVQAAMSQSGQEKLYKRKVSECEELTKELTQTKKDLKMQERLSQQIEKKMSDLEKASGKGAGVGTASTPGKSGDLSQERDLVKQLEAEKKQTKALEIEVGKLRQKLERIEATKASSGVGGKDASASKAGGAGSSQELQREMKMMQRQSDMDKNRIESLERELEKLSPHGDTTKHGTFKLKVLRARGLTGADPGKEVSVRVTLAPRLREGKGLVQVSTAAAGTGRGEHQGSPDWGDQLNLAWEGKPGEAVERDRLVFEVVLDGKGVIGAAEMDADLVVTHPKQNGGPKSVLLLQGGAPCGTLDVEVGFSAKE